MFLQNILLSLTKRAVGASQAHSLTVLQSHSRPGEAAPEVAACLDAGGISLGELTLSMCPTKSCAPHKGPGASGWGWPGTSQHPGLRAGARKLCRTRLAHG